MAFAVARDPESGGSAANVTVMASSDDPAPRQFDSADSAEAHAVEVAGFGPLAPLYIPAGYQLTFIGVGDLPRPEVGTDIRRVTVRLESDDGQDGITILVANRPFGFPGDGEENVVERPNADAKLFRDDEGAARGYTLMTADRGILVKSGLEGTSDDDLRAIALSYAQKQ